VEDRWSWQLDLAKGYTISGVYHLLSNVKEIVHVETVGTKCVSHTLPLEF